MIQLVDYFDTLVHRSIYPEGVKKLWASKIANIYNLNTDIYKIRFHIEEKLCKKSYEIYQELEFKFDEMCKELYIELGNIDSWENFLNNCRNIELQIEQQCQYLNLNTIFLIKNLKNKGFKIYLVSDFYLDKNLFESLLHFHNIHYLFDEIFISSEYMASKRSGKMYQIILKKLNINDNSSVNMLGDNELADFINPQKYGISSKLITLDKHKKFYNLNYQTTPIEKILNLFHASYNVKERVVYHELGLALYLFINNLTLKLIENKCKNVFFLSREGEFLKTLFDQYVNYKNIAIKSHYFLASRRSTFLPSLNKLNEENFEVLFRQYINISPVEFLLNLNFSNIQIEELTKGFHFNFDKRINDFPNSLEFKELLKNKKFYEFYENNRIEQTLNITKYLMNFNINVDEIHIVDIGWKGSIQDNLAKIFKKSQIFGYYLGLNLSGSSLSNNIKYGILFDTINSWNKNSKNSFFNECTSIFEVILSASHGSAKEYTKEGNINLLNNDFELNLFKDKIFPLQNQILEYNKLLTCFFDFYYPNIKNIEKQIANIYANFIFTPSNTQFTIYNNLKHIESFGVHEVTTFEYKKTTFIKSLYEFLRNPKNYLKFTFWPSHKLIANKLGFLTKLYKLYRIGKTHL